MNEDLSHDAHLRAALRHAPDHALSPPSGLSQTILAAARQAHRPARALAPAPVPMRVATARPLRAWLRRLASPRWAGALATGLVATLGLGLWLDLGLQPVVERPSVTGNGPGAARSADAPARSPTPTSDTAATAARDAMTQAAAAPPAPVQAPEAATLAKAAAPKPRPANSEAAAGPSAQRREASPGVTAQAGAKAETSSAMHQDAVPAPAAAMPEMGERSRPSTGGVDEARSAAAASEQATPAPAVRLSEEAGATRGAGAAGKLSASRAAITGEASPAAAGAEAVPAASPALTLLRRARAESAAGSARWTWQAPGSTAMAPFDEAGQSWLLQVVQSARGRWTDVAQRGEALDALEVRWWRDGWPHATLRIEADGLRWIEPSGRVRFAPLDAAALQRLRSL